MLTLPIPIGRGGPGIFQLVGHKTKNPSSFEWGFNKGQACLRAGAEALAQAPEAVPAHASDSISTQFSQKKEPSYEGFFNKGQATTRLRETLMPA